MKKTIIILIALLSLGIIGGGLVTTLANLDTVQPDVNNYTAINPFPFEMPHVVRGSVNWFSLR